MIRIILLVLLTFPLLGSSQILLNQNKYLNPDRDALLIPTISFYYAIDKSDFLAVNHGIYKKRTFIPEILGGVLLVSDGFTIGLHYGFLQNSIMLTSGIVLPLRRKRIKY
jgi:hypothetical protein